jgi:hypothetical protein
MSLFVSLIFLEGISRKGGGLRAVRVVFGRDFVTIPILVLRLCRGGW